MSSTNSSSAISSLSAQRINEDKLRRFYIAADGDLSCLLASIKKTIRWRETYRILSEEELEIGSNMVFWHEFDMEHQPCLIVRLGIACLNLPSHDRARFSQAVNAVSQVERGVLHLVDAENPHITVLVAGEGLSPLRIPMQLLRGLVLPFYKTIFLTVLAVCWLYFFLLLFELFL